MVVACARAGPSGRRAIDDSLVADRLAGFETEITGLRALCRSLVERHEAGTAGAADASIVKLYYSELQVRGAAGGHQVDGARLAVRHAAGGYSNCVAMWVVGSERP
jgi:alkylation response protein AidB-like acyl-CoA dehydrogenase